MTRGSKLDSQRAHPSQLIYARTLMTKLVSVWVLLVLEGISRAGWCWVSMTALLLSGWEGLTLGANVHTFAFAYLSFSLSPSTLLFLSEFLACISLSLPLSFMLHGCPSCKLFLRLREWKRGRNECSLKVLCMLGCIQGCLNLPPHDDEKQLCWVAA